MSNRKTSHRPTSGFALVTALLLLLLLTAIAIGTVYLVATEVSVGGNDLEDTKAYYGAEAAMEKMMVDIGNLYASRSSPSATDISNLAATGNQPTLSGITYNTYQFVVPATANVPTQQTRTISQGPNQGLIAQIVPVTLTVDAQRTFSGADVKMIRNVEVALIPIFQFGVFSDADLAYFPTPNFDFNGRVHTNGNLFLAGGGNLIFHSKITAYKDVIRQYFTNGLNAQTATGYNGDSVLIPTTANGCDGAAAKPNTNCRALHWAEGSLTGNLGSSATANWTTISKTTYGGLLLNGKTGVRPLNLPFVAGGFKNIELIRRPWPGEATSTVQAVIDLNSSRLYSIAQIRILLNDQNADLPTSGTRLANIAPYYNSATGTFGGSATNPAFAEAQITTDLGAPVYEPGLGGCKVNTDNTNPCWSKCTFVAATTRPTVAAHNSCTGLALLPAALTPSSRQDFVLPAGNTAGGCMNTAAYPSNNSNPNCWSLIDGYLLVQSRKSDGTYVDVTAEWLSFGISRDTFNNPNPGQLNYTNPGTYVSTNSDTDTLGTHHPNNAILKFQTYRHIDVGAGVVSANQNSSNIFDVTGHATNGSDSGYVFPGAYNNTINPAVTLTDQDPGKYYPIQMYDPREGLFRDQLPTPITASTCPAYGVMNIIELDVNNLRRWLSGALAPSPATNAGTNTESVTQNGYLVYFSDRRGMQQDPNAPAITGGTASRLTGGYGFEDVVNPAATYTLGTPNGTLDTGEDSNLNGVLDTWGAASVGTAFNVTSLGGTAVPSTPYVSGSGFNETYANDPLLMIGTNNGASLNQMYPSCSNVGRKNRVSGARHALRLVNGTLGNLPGGPGTASASAVGGFSVASENPVYVLGDYNAVGSQGFTDPSCTATTSTTCHVSSAVMADAVTMLSNPGSGTLANPGWSDFNDWVYPVSSPQNRYAQSTYYRLAIVSGKNPTFPQPSVSGTSQEYGTDGGVHNFLRYIESWGWPAASNTCCGLYYKGSIVSLYYSEYSSGYYKGTTNSQYTAPGRGYSFDIDFLTIALLPPGTPKFRDVDNVGFQQIFTPY